MNYKYKLIGIIFSAIIFFLFLSAVFGYYHIIPGTIDFDKYKARINSVFERRILYPSELGKLDIELSWNLRARVKTDKALIKKLNGEKFVELGPSYIEVPILPLLDNRVTIKKISINALEADIKRFKNGEFDISGIFARVEKPRYKVSVKNADILINGYKLRFQDNLAQTRGKYLFAGKSVKIDKFSPDKYIQVCADGRTFFNDRPGVVFNISFTSTLPFLKSKKFRLGGKLKNLDLKTINPYLDGKLTLEGSGDANFNLEVHKKYFGRNKFFIDADLKDLKVKTPEHGVISEHGGNLKVQGRGHYNENLTSLDNLKITGKDIDMAGSGEIKKGYVNFRLKLGESRVSKIALLFPKIYKIKREPFKKVLKYGLKADVFGEIKLKGHPKKPDMFGKIQYKNLGVIKDDTPKSYGKIDFIGPEMVLRNKIFIDSKNFANVNGKLSPYKYKTINLDITTGDMDFNKASKIMFIAQDFLKFKLGPVEKMKFKGIGRVNLNISGKFSDTRINGYVEGKGLEVKYRGLYRSANNVRGRVLFAGKKVYYDEIRGFSDGMEIIPSGYSTLKGYSDAKLHIPELELGRGLALVNKSPLLKASKAALKNVLIARGRADARIHLRGSRNKLESAGRFLFKNGYGLYRGFGAPFENLGGVLKFENKNVYFKNLQGSAGGNKAVVSGFINHDNYSELRIVSDSVNLSSAKNFVNNSPILEKTKIILDDYTGLSGKSSLEISLKGNLDQDPFESITLKKMACSFNHKLTRIPVSLNKGILKITAEAVEAKDIEGSARGIEFKTSGNMLNDFSLFVKRFDFSKFPDFINAPLTPVNIKQFFSEFDKFNGVASLEIHAKPGNTEINITPVNVSAVYRPYNVFFLLNSGTAKISGEKMEFSALKGLVSESNFAFDGFADKDKFDLTANFNINSNDIAKYRLYSDVPLIAGGVIPLSLNLKGNPENWELFGQMLLKKGSYLSYLTDIGLPRDRVRVVNIDARGGKNRININRLGIDMGNKNLISIYGAIDKIKTSKPVFKDFAIKTNAKDPIKTGLFNTSAVFKADLTLNGHVAAPKIQGRASFQDIIIPDYRTSVSFINLDFIKNAAKVDVSNLKIGESVMNIAAVMDNRLESPMLIKDLQINAPVLNIDEIVGIFPGNARKEPDKPPPLAVKNGKLNAGEMVVSNLVTENVRASFNFTPDRLLSVPEISLTATNGTARGNIFYNFKTTELSSGLKIRGMQANAIATTLLSLPNEVYGTISGDVRFSTRGGSQRELIKNSNGYAKFNATKGNFVRLGSLEYLLRAVNVLHSGVGGFNLNNIIDLVSPQKTGHFETLQGSVYAKNGVLYTDDITSSGKNLSLFISGRLDMLTNHADIQVLGRLSKKVSGMLGPVGSISINQFIDYIPGLGFLPTTPDRKGVIDLIPGLSKIPGLELADDKKFRRFAVQINGDLYDQGSVRSFRWVE